MGVIGITSYLQQRGCLPPRTGCCSTKLWNEWKHEDSSTGLLSTATHILPPNSTLLIDGNGLAFYLHRVAHSRYVRSVTTNGDHTSQSPTFLCPSVNTLTREEISQCLPSMMPLELLKNITKEYIKELRKHQVHIQVYWDGPYRRFKETTKERRVKQRLRQWLRLKEFCEGTDVIPMDPMSRVCSCFHLFPLSTLFLKCVRHVFHVAHVETIHCEGDADSELAQRACHVPNAFVLGADSDFFFFRGIQYIPFDGLYLPQSTNVPIKATCLTRARVARELGLKQYQLVELAMILGNDYVDRNSLEVPSSIKGPSDAINWLRTKPVAYQVKSKYRALELSFVRAWYDLRSMNQFPLNRTIRDKTNEELDEAIRALVSFPKFHLVHDTIETKLQHLIYQNLREYAQNHKSVHQNGGILSKEHLAAYKKSTKLLLHTPSGKHQICNPCLLWKDVRAAYIIETCVRMTMNATKVTAQVQWIAPGKLVNHLQFHSILSNSRADSKVPQRSVDISDVIVPLQRLRMEP